MEKFILTTENEQDGIATLNSSLQNVANIVDYLNGYETRCYKFGQEQSSQKQLEVTDFFLYQLQEITYEDKAPERETMENIVSVFRNEQGVNLVYLILGDTSGVKFYLGVAKDLSGEVKSKIDIDDVAKKILLPAIMGNFRGCRYWETDNETKKDILALLQKHSDDKKNASLYSGMLEGIPTINEHNNDEERFQGVERLADVMLSNLGKNDTFAVLTVIKPHLNSTIAQLEQNVYDVCDLLSPAAEESIQYSCSHGHNENHDIRVEFSKSARDSVSSNHSNRYSKSENNTDDYRREESSNIQVTKSDGANYGYQEGNSCDDNSNSKSHSSESSNTNHSLSYQGNDQYTNGYAENHTTSKGTVEDHSDDDSSSKSVEKNYGRSKSNVSGNNVSGNFSTTQQTKIGNKNINSWLKYVDDILLPRLDKGKGKGLFQVCTYLYSNNQSIYLRLSRTMTSLFGGEIGNKTPLRVIDLYEHGQMKKTKNNSDTSDICLRSLQNMQIPVIRPATNELANLATFFSLFLTGDQTENGRKFCGNWMTADELSVLAGMPQKEVIGLTLRKEVDFGLNVAGNQSGESIKLGNIVKNGAVQNNMPVGLLKANLDKHIFVTGVTGSGKTNTCRKILVESGYPFMVVEPAKTEYRVLEGEDILYFTLGDNKGAPFFLNPFELFPGEAITSRADMLKATFEATFHMEAAIPQLLEAAIYRVYKDKGWSIGNNTWYGKDDSDEDGPFAKGVDAFPTLQDFFDIMPKIIKEQGFDERLHDEYLGTVRALLQGLMVGSKGMMFNTPHSVNFSDLVTKKVVIELEDVKSGAEKSMIMGFIMTNLMQAVKAEYYKCKKNGERFNHITLVEEAHRLLSRYQPGDSNNKKQGVEVFADMLAEVRKYGECLIIVDQIPDKMTPEVLKNTNTKIVHKIFAQDDKDMIGNTMALSDEQKEFLSNLSTGRAIVFTQDWTKAVQVQIDEYKSEQSELEKKDLRDRVMKYYVNHINDGIFPGMNVLQLDKLTECDKIKTLEKYLKLRGDDGFRELIMKEHHFSIVERLDEFINTMKKYVDENGVNALVACFVYIMGNKIQNKDNRFRIDDHKVKKIFSLVEEISSGKVDKNSFRRNYSVIF